MWIEDQKANASDSENVPDLQKAMDDGQVALSPVAGGAGAKINATPRHHPTPYSSSSCVI